MTKGLPGDTDSSFEDLLGEYSDPLRIDKEIIIDEIDRPDPPVDPL